MNEALKAIWLELLDVLVGLTAEHRNGTPVRVADLTTLTTLAARLALVIPDEAAAPVALRDAA